MQRTIHSKATSPTTSQHLRFRTLIYALACGTGAPIVYSGIYLLLVTTGDFFGLKSALPDPGVQSWVVGPGAALMGGWMAWRLDGMRLALPKRLLWGGLAGAGLGILNTPFTLGLLYTVELVRSVLAMGTVLHWSDYLSNIGAFIFMTFLAVLAVVLGTLAGVPIAAPCGAVMGIVIALLCRKTRNTL